MSTRWLAALGVVALASLVTLPAAAHVGPSPQVNNRYLTLVPESGAVELVYTLIFGQAPGNAARQRMDQSGDGTLSEGEQRAFADSIAEVIAGGLKIELDGERLDVAWHRVELSIGTATTEGGPFSIDLAARFCFEPGEEHTLRLEDAFRVPPVGEGALVIEPAGVEIGRSAMGGGEGLRRTFKWMGRGAIAEDGYVLAFRVPEGAVRSPDCPDSAPGGAPAPDSPPDTGEAETASTPDDAAGGSGDGEVSEGRGGPGRVGLAAAALAVVLAVLFAVGAMRRRR